MFELELRNGTSRITKMGEPQRSIRLKINRVEVTWSAALFLIKTASSDKSVQ